MMLCIKAVLKKWKQDLNQEKGWEPFYMTSLFSSLKIFVVFFYAEWIEHELQSRKVVYRDFQNHSSQGVEALKKVQYLKYWDKLKEFQVL